MILRTLAGPRAGQLEHYSMEAGLAALRAGFAERVGDVGPVVVPTTTSPPVSDQTTSDPVPVSEPVERSGDKPRTRRRK